MRAIIIWKNKKIKLIIKKTRQLIDELKIYLKLHASL